MIFVIEKKETTKIRLSKKIVTCVRKESEREKEIWKKIKFLILKNNIFLWFFSLLY